MQKRDAGEETAPGLSHALCEGELAVLGEVDEQKDWLSLVVLLQVGREDNSAPHLVPSHTAKVWVTLACGIHFTCSLVTLACGIHFTCSLIILACGIHFTCSLVTLACGIHFICSLVTLVCGMHFTSSLVTMACGKHLLLWPMEYIYHIYWLL